MTGHKRRSLLLLPIPYHCTHSTPHSCSNFVSLPVDPIRLHTFTHRQVTSVTSATSTSPTIKSLLLPLPSPATCDLCTLFFPPLIAFVLPVSGFLISLLSTKSPHLTGSQKHGAFQEARRHPGFAALTDSPGVHVRRQLPRHCQSTDGRACRGSPLWRYCHLLEILEWKRESLPQFQSSPGWIEARERRHPPGVSSKLLLHDGQTFSGAASYPIFQKKKKKKKKFEIIVLKFREICFGPPQKDPCTG